MNKLGTLHVTAGYESGKAERKRLMDEYAVRFNGRHYESGPYRYGRLADAIDAARRSRTAPHPPWNARASHASSGGAADAFARPSTIAEG